jgi:hypothetical protein
VERRSVVRLIAGRLKQAAKGAVKLSRRPPAAFPAMVEEEILVG